MDDLDIPAFLKRTTPGELMTQKPEPKAAEDTEQSLEAEATELSSEIAHLDGQIKLLSAQRAQKHKLLRGITSKLVTIKLKSK